MTFYSVVATIVYDDPLMPEVYPTPTFFVHVATAGLPPAAIEDIVVGIIDPGRRGVTRVIVASEDPANLLAPHERQMIIDYRRACETCAIDSHDLLVNCLIQDV